MSDSTDSHSNREARSKLHEKMTVSEHAGSKLCWSEAETLFYMKNFSEPGVPFL